MLRHADLELLLPVFVVLYAGFLAALVLIDCATGWQIAEAFGKTPPREPCAYCGDPQGEGACESADCITPSGYGLYVPSEQDIADGYIRLIEQESIYR